MCKKTVRQWICWSQKLHVEMEQTSKSQSLKCAIIQINLNWYVHLLIYENITDRILQTSCSENQDILLLLFLQCLRCSITTLFCTSILHSVVWESACALKIHGCILQWKYQSKWILAYFNKFSKAQELCYFEDKRRNLKGTYGFL